MDIETRPLMLIEPQHPSLSADEIAALKREIFRERPWAARASLALAIQMKVMWHGGGDYWSLWDAIENLERETVDSPGSRRASTKSATDFTSRPLKGFWHQHVSAPHHIMRNVADRWGLRHGGNKALDALIANTARIHGDDEEGWLNHLAHGFTIGAYDERAVAKRLTGDWLIFAKHADTDYYLLTIAHPPDKSHDADIHRQLEASCKAEFPFLFTA